MLGLTVVDLNSILNGELKEAEIEFHSAIIDTLVFKKTQIPPSVLIDNVINSFASGLSKKKKVRDFAVSTRTFHEHHGAWF